MTCLLGDCQHKSSCKCALIRWTDITSYDGSWMGLEEAKALKPAQMETLGWIIKEDEDYIVIASTLDSGEDIVGSINAIPRGVISEIRLNPREACGGVCGETEGERGANP